MILGDRKHLILQAIIDDYVNTAEPVGSRTISKKYLMGLSPATIRNEMADLEDMGYIEQPHTSAGRVPSDKGYRLYVDKLLGQRTTDENQSKVIRNEFIETIGEIDKLVKHASKLLSQLTHYTSIVMAPQIKSTSLKHLQLIKLDSTTVLAVIVTNAGLVKNSALRLINDIDQSTLEKINNVLNEKLNGFSLNDISTLPIEEIASIAPGHWEIIDQALHELIQTLKYSDSIEIYQDGIANILNLPEFSDIGRARSFLGNLENKKLLYELLIEGKDDVNISIGKENKHEQFRDCSVITATYKVNGNTIGSIGVVGPTRMDYSKVIAVVDGMTDSLNDILTRIFNK